MARIVWSARLQQVAARHAAVERALWHLEILLVRVLWLVCGALPVDHASALGDWLGRRVGPRLRKHRHVVRNLQIALPERDPDFIRATAVAAWGQTGRVLAEYPHLARLSSLEPEPRIELAATFDLDLLRRPGRPAIFVAPHLANWNLPGVTGKLVGVPLSVVFGRQRNPPLEALIERYRSTMPCGFLDAAAGSRALLAELVAGRSIGMHVDQRVDRGEMVPFFGIDAPTVTIPARLALRMGALLIPTRIERLTGARFRITLYDPIPPGQGDDPRAAARAMMREVHAHFERWIRERPDQWVCARRRWPKAQERAPAARARAFAL